MTHGTLFFEDFAPGQVYESQGRTITEADVVSFAGWSWDTNPVHTDAVSAGNGRFGGRIAHGLLGMSVAMGLTSRLGIFEGSSIALLGVEDWRFVRPIHIGDTVSCRVEILGTRLTSTGDAGVLDRRFSLVNQHGDVVQEGKIGLLVATRPADWDAERSGASKSRGLGFDAPRSSAAQPAGLRVVLVAESSHCDEG